MTPEPPVRRITLSAFFEDRQGVDEAVYRLGLLGLPRDLIDVAATPEVARRHYGRQGTTHGRRAGRWAAMGALVGLLAGIAVSLALVASPFELTGAMAIVQLLGPNALTMVGALLGAAYGALTPRPKLGVYERLRERTDALLLVIRQIPASDADGMSDLVRSLGGAAVAVH